LQEQLDIERERVTELLEAVIGKRELNIDSGEVLEKTKRETRQSKSWNAQKLRLIEKANRDYKERMKDAQRESNQISKTV